MRVLMFATFAAAAAMFIAVIVQFDVAVGKIDRQLQHVEAVFSADEEAR